MLLPPIIIFERHWDTIPKEVVKELLPTLSTKGYRTLCFEFPKDLSIDEMLKRHQNGLETDFRIQQEAQLYLANVGIKENLNSIGFRKLNDLIKNYCSSKHSIEVAEKIKNLPASCMMKEIFDMAKEYSLSLKGIDIESAKHDEMISKNMVERITDIRALENLRITTMVQSLLDLQKNSEGGVVFTCGALHAKNLITELKKNGQKELLYYFPHSKKRWDENLDDIKMLTIDVLRDHAHLLSEHEVERFGKRVIEDVKNVEDRINYRKEIVQENSHSQFLQQLFKTNIRLFWCFDFNVDALIHFDNAKEVRSSLEAIDIQAHDITLDGQKYLVIPNVNSAEIADRLRKIAS
ncbi:MAG: hypothetical protein QRY74_04150 [Chlamydia sp.]